MKAFLAFVCIFASMALLEAQSNGGSSGEMSSANMGNGLDQGGQMNGNNFFGNDNEESDNDVENDFNSDGAGMPNLFGNGASGLTDKGAVGNGAKAGIAIAVIALVAVVAGGIFYFVKRR
ncbi:uncharacterized protein [Diadema setosum]|uniref:uncharacterized protein n=1 Tax=Diadema setosum TaxID=31175 RepID=UPI003B3AD900